MSKCSRALPQSPQGALLPPWMPSGHILEFDLLRLCGTVDPVFVVTVVLVFLSAGGVPAGTLRRELLGE